MALAAAITGGAVSARATVIGTPDSRRDTPAPHGNADNLSSGLRLLKAQMNAMRDGLDNIEQLKKFFEADKPGKDIIVRNAERLIKSLPQTENAGDAAWRVAAVASLASQSGELASLKISEDYQLPAGAVGWDFGGTGSPVHRGFTPITPEIMAADDGQDGGQPVAGESSLTDGIARPPRFQSSLPNGLYRILIIANPDQNIEEGGNPFGDRITVNGDPLGHGGLTANGKMESRNLGTASGDKVASARNGILRQTALGLGIETWAIVRDGHLDIDFAGLPADRAISAVIADPIDLNKTKLVPAVAEALATAFTNLAPAAGPEPRSDLFGRGRSGIGTSGRGQSGNRGQASTPAPAPKAIRNDPAPAFRPSFVNSFNDSRRNLFASTSNTAAVQKVVSSPAQTGTTEQDDFFDRQLLVNQDSDGLAVDLGALLDDGSASGTFLCEAEPCAPSEITEEPDLSAAAAALGDWLTDPEHLGADWEDVAAVLDGWSTGSEIAAVYKFNVDTDLWTDVELRANVSDGILIWIDGNFVYGATGPGTFDDQAGYDYRISLPDLTGGDHVLQIIAESRGPDTPGLSFELRGTPADGTQQTVSSTSVPEPGTIALFGLGLIGLAMIRRGKRRFDKPVRR